MKSIIANFSKKIKRKETWYFALFYDVAKGALDFNVPYIAPLHAPASYLHQSLANGSRYVIQKTYYEPLFRSKCHRCGKKLQILEQLPFVENHLLLEVGDNVTFNGHNAFHSPAMPWTPTLTIGDNCYIGYQVAIGVGKSVTIGNDCLLAARVFIIDNNGHPLEPEGRRRRDRVDEEDIKPVTIGNNVWIGYQAFIGPGVTIGDNSVIAANSSVLTSVPENSIIVGNPGRVLGKVDGVLKRKALQKEAQTKSSTTTAAPRVEAAP